MGDRKLLFLMNAEQAEELERLGELMSGSRRGLPTTRMEA